MGACGGAGAERSEQPSERQFRCRGGRGWGWGGRRGSARARPGRSAAARERAREAGAAPPAVLSLGAAAAAARGAGTRCGGSRAAWRSRSVSSWRGGRAPGGLRAGGLPAPLVVAGRRPVLLLGAVARRPGRARKGRTPRARVSPSRAARTPAGPFLPNRGVGSRARLFSVPPLRSGDRTASAAAPGLCQSPPYVGRYGGRAEGLCSLHLWGTESTAARSSCLHCAFVHTRGVGSQDPGETGLGGAQVAQVWSLPLQLLNHFGPFRRLASLGIC